MLSKKKEITFWNKNDLDVDISRLGLQGSPTKVVKTFSPQKDTNGKIYKGNPREIVSSFLKDMQERGIDLKMKG